MVGAELMICNGGFDGMEYPITAEETLIGRNPTTDVTLLDENISREHVRSNSSGHSRWWRSLLGVLAICGT